MTVNIIIIIIIITFIFSFIIIIIWVLLKYIKNGSKMVGTQQVVHIFFFFVILKI